MRRIAAIVLLLASGTLLAIDLRPVSDPDGIVRMSWRFLGSQVGVASPLPIDEFARIARGHLPWLFAIALLASLALGWRTASEVGARLSLPVRTGTKLCLSLAWAAALDPWIAVFVATRQPHSADRYLEIGDLFHSLGLSAAGIGLLALLARRGQPAAVREKPATTLAEPASLWAAIAVAILLPEVISWSCLGHHPLSSDEFAYLFQAELFAGGELARHAGAFADFFPSVRTQISDGRIFAIVFPGHSALLVPGVWVGFPMLLPRLLSGASVLLTWLLGRRLGLARPLWGAWALALSPAFLGVESLNLAHGTSLPCLLLFVWAVIEAIDRSSVQRQRSLACACLAGLSFSVAFAARPVTAIAIAVPVLALLVRERPRGAARLAAAALAASLPAALLFLEFNRRLTGSPFQSVYSAFYTMDVSVYGSVDPGTAASITAFNLSRISVWLVGLAPGLLLPALALAFGRRGPRIWLLAALPGSLLAFYALHPFHGIPWVGPVYLSEALPYLALLAAEGLVVVGTAFGPAAARAGWTLIAVGSLALLADHFLLARDEIGMRQRPYDAVAQAGIDRGVVFLRIETPSDWRLYPIAPPEPGSPLVFARDLGGRNRELLAALGNPPAYLCEPSSGELRRLE